MTSAGIGTGGAGAGAMNGGTAGMDPDLIELDGPRCDSRRAADCTGVSSYNDSGSLTFRSAPELSDCASYVSFDGCGKLVFSFDTNGCAVSVGPGSGGWATSAHLDPLRECLTKVFNSARFACLASGTLSFWESCYVP